MAAWASMSDDAYDAQESYGEHVRVSDFYDEWDGELTAAITQASILCDGVDIPLEGGRPGIAAPAPSEIHSLADRITASLDAGDRIVLSLDAALAAESQAEQSVRDAWADVMALAEQLDAA